LENEGLQPANDENDIRRAEIDILLKDFIADVGGFLYAGKKGSPIKRTSCFQVGYATPTLWDKESAALESQFHVRFAPSKPEVQIPYNVEVGSAIYTFSLNLDTSRIGTPSTGFGTIEESKEKELEKSKPERVKAALSALLKFYSSMPFGAKRSRFLPNMELLSAVASYSKDIRFVVSPGNGKGYVRNTVNRKKDLVTCFEKLGLKNVDVALFAFDKEKASEGTEITLCETIEKVIEQLVEKSVEELKQPQG
jgi:CRISPR-associated protein Csa2